MEDLNAVITINNKINFDDLLKEFSIYLYNNDIDDDISIEELENNIDKVNHFIIYDDIKYFYIPNGIEYEDICETKILAEEIILNIANDNGVNNIDLNNIDDYAYEYKIISEKDKDNMYMKFWSIVYLECNNNMHYSFIKYEKNMNKFINKINNNFSELYK